MFDILSGTRTILSVLSKKHKSTINSINSICFNLKSFQNADKRYMHFLKYFQPFLSYT